MISITVFRNNLHVCAEEQGQDSQYCGYAMGWTVQGSISGSDSDFYLLQIIRTGFGSNPTSYSGGTEGYFPQLVCEDNNSHLSTAKVKNGQSCTSAVLYSFMAWTETAVPLAFTV